MPPPKSPAQKNLTEDEFEEEKDSSREGPSGFKLQPAGEPSTPSENRRSNPAIGTLGRSREAVRGTATSVKKTQCGAVKKIGLIDPDKVLILGEEENFIYSWALEDAGSTAKNKLYRVVPTRSQAVLFFEPAPPRLAHKCLVMLCNSDLLIFALKDVMKRLIPKHIGVPSKGGEEESLD